MKIALTNVGHRRAQALLDPALVALGASVFTPWKDDPAQRNLLSRGYVELWPDSTGTAGIELRQRRNPLEHLRKAYIEFTTRCNLSCAHCYNAGVPRRTETDLEALASATDALAEIGIREFAFIGGEVTKYAEGWLDLAARLRSRGAKIVSVLTSGWFLAQEGFEAAGRRYADARALFDDMREHGVTHVCFSLDGRGEAHDRSRGLPGLYGRVLAGFAQARSAGLLPRVSLLAREGDDTSAHLRELSQLLYEEGPAGGFALALDDTNIVSNFIDIGNGASASGPYALAEFPPEALRCAGFFRPSPHITLKANGELATCRLANAGEYYGNFHRRPLVEILNRMQDSFVYRLHAEKRIGDYLRFVDGSIFGNSFEHPCSLRAIVTMLAGRMHEQGVLPDDAVGIARINVEVAKLTGYMKTEGVHNRGK